MTLRKRRLAVSRLYLILDASVLDYDRLFHVLKSVVSCGVDVVQLRDKDGKACEMLVFAEKIRKILNSKALFIINDRVDIAKFSGADGVHLGQEDIPVAKARRLLGARAIIGCSCQSSEHVLAAQKEGADYIGFGSVFETKTKPGRVPASRKNFDLALSSAEIPFFPIGGITCKNVPILMRWGAERIAVCRDILLADQPCQVVKNMRYYLDG